jgi:hypothetical protein
MNCTIVNSPKKATHQILFWLFLLLLRLLLHLVVTDVLVLTAATEKFTDLAFILQVSVMDDLNRRHHENHDQKVCWNDYSRIYPERGNRPYFGHCISQESNRRGS